MAVKEVLDVDLLDPSLYRSGMPHALHPDLRKIGPVLWHPRRLLASQSSRCRSDWRNARIQNA
jgi:hypothetical protein